MDTVLKEIQGVTCCTDDILVSSINDKSHIQATKVVFCCLKRHGFTLKLEKYELILPRVEYLGHLIRKVEIQPILSKEEAIIHDPAPANVQ